MQVRALLAAAKLLVRDPQTSAEIARQDTALLAALSSRLSTAPDRAVKSAAAAGMAAILSAGDAGCRMDGLLMMTRNA